MPVFEVSVEQRTTEEFVVEADSREEAWEAFEYPRSRNVEREFTKRDWAYGPEYQPLDARRAEELEDREDKDEYVDIEIESTEA